MVLHTCLASTGDLLLGSMHNLLVGAFHEPVRVAPKHEVPDPTIPGKPWAVCIMNTGSMNTSFMNTITGSMSTLYGCSLYEYRVCKRRLHECRLYEYRVCQCGLYESKPYQHRPYRCMLEDACSLSNYHRAFQTGSRWGGARGVC